MSLSRTTARRCRTEGKKGIDEVQMDRNEVGSSHSHSSQFGGVRPGNLLYSQTSQLSLELPKLSHEVLLAPTPLDQQPTQDPQTESDRVAGSHTHLDWSSEALILEEDDIVRLLTRLADV